MSFTCSLLRVSASFEYLATHLDGCTAVGSYSSNKPVDIYTLIQEGADYTLTTLHSSKTYKKTVSFTPVSKSPDDKSESTERVVMGYVFFSLIFDSISIVFPNDTGIWHILFKHHNILTTYRLK